MLISKSSAKNITYTYTGYRLNKTVLLYHDIVNHERFSKIVARRRRRHFVDKKNVYKQQDNILLELLAAICLQKEASALTKSVFLSVLTLLLFLYVMCTYRSKIVFICHIPIIGTIWFSIKTLYFMIVKSTYHVLLKGYL